jgi:uncharacterized integral membrane protein (TIGR00698 family)
MPSRCLHLTTEVFSSVARSATSRVVLFWLLVAVAASSVWIPLISPPVALALGLLFALTGEHPYPKQSSNAMKWLLQASVVGLGFGMNVYSVVKAGQIGFGFTAASIVGTLGLGWIVGKVLGVQGRASHLIGVGTAICGGSAIAAVAPVIEAEEAEISVALGTVFVLNALALFMFPPIGWALGLSEQQFGVWAAIAIHDTSSVVGAAAKYGEEALATATTVKLSRALWIIPITLVAALSMSRTRHQRTIGASAVSGAQASITVPWFVLLFVLASLGSTLVPGAQVFSVYLVSLAKVGLTVTLFLIGAGLSRSMLRAVGVQPLMQGVVLWTAISLLGLWAVKALL